MKNFVPPSLLRALGRPKFALDRPVGDGDQMCFDLGIGVVTRPTTSVAI